MNEKRDFILNTFSFAALLLKPTMQ